MDKMEEPQPPKKIRKISLEGAEICQQTVYNQGTMMVFNSAGGNVNAGGFTILEQQRDEVTTRIRKKCTELKEYYTNTFCQAPPRPAWYPDCNWNIDTSNIEVYTELTLKNTNKFQFGVEELFKQARQGGSYRILIEGDAGYGKSTLMRKITSDWTRRDPSDPMNYTSPFILLFLVQLGYVGEDGDILSYMASVYDEKIDTALNNLVKSNEAKKVLILLDGYDEANSQTRNEVNRIMRLESMNKCHVVLTSRFGHVTMHYPYITQTVTVNGFGRRQVTEAIGKFFITTGHITKKDVISCLDELSTSNKGSVSFGASHSINELDDPNIDDFKNVQEIIPLLPEEERLSLKQFKRFMRQVLAESPYKELAQSPLLCVMLCCLVSERPKGKLPSTCSGLYFAMINRNLWRAAAKKARAAEEVVEEWDLSVLDSQIREGHEGYLRDFGRLCMNGLKTGSTSFTSFAITGNKEAAITTNVKVTQLIEAGVLVKDFSNKEKITRYQVPHRTMAEFLAAYYLSTQTEHDIVQQKLLELFQLKASFDEVAVFLLEMGKQRLLTDAFRAIKFPSYCLTHFLRNYFIQHCASGSWSEFEHAMPNKLIMIFSKHLPGSEENARPTFDSFTEVTVTSADPSLTLLKLVEEFGKANTGNKEALRSISNDCQEVSVVVIKEGGSEALQFPLLLQTLLKSGVVINSLEYTQYSYWVDDETNDELRQESARSLKALLRAGSCPVELSFGDVPVNLLHAVTKAMEEVPAEACLLKSFTFLGKNLHTTELSEALAEKWLSHLQHLGIKSEDWGSADTLNPIFKRLSQPGCTLTSLHLRKGIDNPGSLFLEDLMMLASKLETLKLEEINLRFDAIGISKYAVKQQFSLKSLHLVKVSLSLDGLLPSADENKEFLLALRNVARNLEELTIDGCTFPIEFFSGLNLFVPNLRILAIGSIHSMTPNNGKEFYANQLLEALTRSSGESLEDLSLLQHFWESNYILMLHPIREALHRCPIIKTASLGISWITDKSQVSIGPDPDPSIPLSSNDIKALKNKNFNSALLEIVLSVSKLQTLTMKSYLPRTFHVIADKAEKWPGKTNDNECKTSLTLHDLSNENACLAIQVFKERELKYRLTYVTDEVYELWFPAKCITEPGASNKDVSLSEQVNGQNSILSIGSPYEDKGNSSQKASSYTDKRKNIPTKTVNANTVWVDGIDRNQRDKVKNRTNLSNFPADYLGLSLIGSKRQPVDIDKLDCTELKEYYLNTFCWESPLPWYPEYAWDVDEVYTGLALQGSAKSKFGVEELFHMSTRTIPQEVFCYHAHKHSREGGSYRILIEGDSGYGKSTLMRKIASDWCKRDSKHHMNYTSPFRLLFVVQLGYVGEDGVILSYMASVYDEKMDTPLQDLLESEQAEKVLILLDGYDEANANTKKEVDRIMKKEKMMDCHVVLTSRFGHAPDAVKSKALRVTVKGFGRKQVMEAVVKFFIKAGHATKAEIIRCIFELQLQKVDEFPSNDGFENVQEIFPLLPEEKRLGMDQFKKFMKKVQDDSPYKELAQCPLLCVMLCCLVSERPNGELPTTCSGLYFAMINRNLWRAASKKARAAEEVVEEWDLSVLDSQIREGHEGYLRDFGRLCMNGLKTGSTSFTWFAITGNKKAAKTTNIKVTQLIEAGVLVQDFTELNTNRRLIRRYQVPHRTMAEFLAAYYLSGETDQNSLQQNLLDLFRVEVSFDEVGVSLIEMGKQRDLVDAFRVVKFPSDCLRTIPFMKSYFTQHGAAGTWSEFKDVLPNELQIKTIDYDIIVSSSEPCLTLLELFEEFGKMNTGSTNVLRSLQPENCPVSLHVKETPNLPILLHTLVKSGFVLNCLKIDGSGSIFTGEMLHEVTRSLQELLKAGSCPVQLSFTDASQSLRNAVIEAMQEVPEACRLRSFEFFANQKRHVDMSPLLEVLAEKWLSHLQHLGIIPPPGPRVPPDNSYKSPSPPIKFKSFLLRPKNKAKRQGRRRGVFLPTVVGTIRRKHDGMTVIQSVKSSTIGGSTIVHHPKPPPRHAPAKRSYSSGPLELLCNCRDCRSGMEHQILKGLTKPGCSLTSLHLCDNNGGMVLEDLMMLATKLVTLRLEGMDLHFDVTKISNYALKEKCSLKSLHLKEINLILGGSLPSADENKELLLGWRNVALSLEELSIDDCEFPVELFSWLNLSVPNLRTLSIGRVVKTTPNRDFYVNQLLEALTRSSGESIEELSLTRDFWEINTDKKVLMLKLIREALQRCPRLKKVKLGIFSNSLPKSIGPGPSTPLSSSGVEALNSDNMYLALLKIVLSVPMLQTLNSYSLFEYWGKSGTFGAIADKAKKWPGKGFDNECHTLTLHGLSNKSACNAMHVFRERKLEYRLRYVSDKVYELWFPV